MQALSRNGEIQKFMESSMRVESSNSYQLNLKGKRRYHRL